ncbi:MAG TPA: PEP-CTERM-box response regulator transcription factor [Planctomycetota bacterium]|jgi:two-component system NtrC family response regulator|nr:PEP-CTERM-box response regulator transcription factor [Planctomycetota bacterium]
MLTSGAHKEDHRRPKVLVVDDDEQIVKQVTWALSEDYHVLPATDRKNALDVFRREKVSVVLLDLGLPPHPREASEGLLALEEMLTHNPLAKVIIVSGNSERENAVQAVGRGAHDIFPKPIDIDALKVVLQRAYRKMDLEQENLLKFPTSAGDPIEAMIGSSDELKGVLSKIRKVATAEVPVLILGESGTGKELCAQTIHRLGARKDGPFVAINCAAIPENLLESELFGYEKGAFTGATAQKRGRFEYAHGGSLFLDEIGDLAPMLQVKLLRFLQERVIERVGGRELVAVDARIIAATNQDLNTAVRENRFREDLYFRLAVVKLSVPPLRERGDDVLQLAEHLLFSFTREQRSPPKKFSTPAIEALRRHSWPGNVRELQNRVKRAVVLADGPLIGPAELELETVTPRAAAAAGTSLREAKEELEREMVAKALADHKGNITQAAKTLGISRPTLYELISRFQL